MATGGYALLDNDTGKVLAAQSAAGGSVTHLGSFTANDAMFPATTPAAASSRNGHAILAFDSAIDESVIFEGVMSKDYSAGSFTVDIFYTANAITSGAVIWDVSFERMDTDSLDIDADSFAAVQSVTDTVAGTDGQISVASITFTQAQADSIAAGESFRMKVNRDANNASDTAAADAQLLRVLLRQ